MAGNSERNLYVSFFLLGMATLLPWNFFITPFAYWMTKLQRADWMNETSSAAPLVTTLETLKIDIEVSLEKETRMIPKTVNLNDSCATGGFEMNDYQKFWNSALGVTTMSTNLVFCFLTTILAKRISRNVRFIGCLIGYIICLAVTLLMVRIDSEEWIETFFISTLVVVIAITICCAIFQTSIFGLAAEFPPEHGIMVAVMGGQGCGGIFACVVNLITLAAFDNALDSAFVFFLLAVVFILFSLFLYSRMPKNDLYRKYIVEKVQASAAPNSRQDEPMLAEKKPSSDEDDNLVPFGKFICTTLWPYMLSVFLVFVVTLGLFPAVASFIQPANYDCNSQYHTKWFVPVWCFTLFNVGDTAGRMLSAKVTFPKAHESYKLLLLSIARFGFVVIFPMCNISPAERATSVLLPYDIVYIIILVLMSMTGGIVSGQAMSYAAQIAPRHLVDDVGNTMGTCLVAGLLGGACFSFAVLAVM